MASSAHRTRKDHRPLAPSKFTPRRHLHIEDYRFGRWRALVRAVEIRRQRAYFPRGSAPFGHYTSRLRHEQRGMLKLRALCRPVREQGRAHASLAAEQPMILTWPSRPVCAGGRIA
jgi:hypothetical protein